jgi:hypothetical protein
MHGFLCASAPLRETFPRRSLGCGWPRSDLCVLCGQFIFGYSLLDEDIWVDDAVCGRFPRARKLAA